MLNFSVLERNMKLEFWCTVFSNGDVEGRVDDGEFRLVVTRQGREAT